MILVIRLIFLIQVHILNGVLINQLDMEDILDLKEIVELSKYHFLMDLVKDLVLFYKVMIGIENIG